jgi:hypothetical protein
VSKTFELLAKAVIIPVVLLCVVDFALWCKFLPTSGPCRHTCHCRLEMGWLANACRDFLADANRSRTPRSAFDQVGRPAAVQTSFVSPSSSGIACPSSGTLLSHTSSDSLGSGEGEYISELTESDTEGSESTYNSESHLELGIMRPLASDICAVTDLIDHNGNAVARWPSIFSDTSVAPQTSVSPLMATAGSKLPLVMRMRTGEAIWTLGVPLQAMSSGCMAE